MTSKQSAVVPEERLIRGSTVWALGIWVASLSGVVGWAVLSPLSSGALSTILGPDDLPPTLVGVALGLSLVLGPWLASVQDGIENGSSRLNWDRCLRIVFIGVWQGVALGFFLVLASRVANLSFFRALQSVLIFAASSMFALTLAAKWPRRYGGIVFLWAVVLPLLSYLLVEIFLNSPSGAPGLGGSQTGDQSWMGWFADWASALSPGTAATAALNGALATGTAVGWKETTIFLFVVAGAGLILLLPPRRDTVPKRVG